MLVALAWIACALGIVGCGVVNNEVRDDLLNNWKMGQILKMGLPEESYKEEFFDPEHEEDYEDYEDSQNDEDFGLPLTPEDFEAGQQLSNKYFSPEKGLDPIHKSGHFEGDINNPKFVEGRNAIRDSHMKWPAGEIPYVIDRSFNQQERSIIARAMGEYHSQTCVRFVPRINHIDYVFITRRTGCFSMIGRDGGQQLLSLGDDCVWVGVVVHELMHAAGFWHEQSRADRDDYVTILWENVQQGQTHNFAKYTDGRLHHLGESYDYSSIMHYGPYDFTKVRGRPTILPKQRSALIGQRDGLSATDVRKINKLYQCADSTRTKGDCVDSDSQCRGWADLGECKKNSKWMHANCRKACNQCRLFLDAIKGNGTISR